MMASSAVEHEIFRLFLEQQLDNLAPADPLYKIRLQARESIEKMGLPTKKTEVYRYLKMRRLYSQSFAAAENRTLPVEQIKEFVLSESSSSYLVFINGYFNDSLSNVSGISSKVVISTMKEATRTYGALINNQMAQSLKEENDAFVAINTALHGEGCFVYIPPKTIIETPIQLLHFSTSQPSAVFGINIPRINVFVGSQAQVTFAATHHSFDPKGNFANYVADFVVEEAAHVQLVQNLIEVPSDAWHFESVRAHLKRNSSFKTFCATKGSATVRTDYRISLAGENCETSLNGIAMLENKNESHVNVLVEHQAPNCRSNQLFKNVLNDFSGSSFEGKIMVRQAAQKTEAFQLNNNIVLSDYAHADSKPNLEIFADDVKASHGATIGQLDKEQLFYMMTRGVSESKAKNLLIYGYCEEVIERIPVESLKTDLSNKARNYLRE